MKFNEINTILGLIVALAVAGCGGSSSTPDPTQGGPAAATPQTTVGQISGFGSVYVNGVEYDTAGARYDVDDVAASGDDALAVGMVVKIEGSVNADGRTGYADAISYDDDIEGPVENLAADMNDSNIKTFAVMGVPVSVSRNGTNFEGEDDPSFDFSTIMNGDNVEVSGEFDGDILVATYVEKQDAADDEFEAKGTVDLYDGGEQFVLVLRNGATLTVSVAPGAMIPSSGIMDGQFVEVEGTIADPVNAPDLLLATKVELEDHDRIENDDEDDVEVKGFLSYDMASATWSVKDVALAFGENTDYSPEALADSIGDLSADGLYVEVEGRYVDEVLQVREIELEDDDLEFKADVESVTATAARDGTVTLSFGLASGTITVNVTPDTIFLDDEAMQHFDLNSLRADNKVEIKARLADDGMIYASSLHLEDDIGYEIEGPVDAIDDVSISILGIAFTLDMDTMFEGGTPLVGDYAEIEDSDADGTADSVELDD